MRRQLAVARLIPVILVFVAVGCLPSPTAWVGDGTRVAVAGDSLVFAAEYGNDPGLGTQFLTDQLNASGRSAAISAALGASMGDLTQSWPEPGPEILVVGLGSNDMHDGQVPLVDALEHLDAHLARYEGACTVLIGIAESTPWQLDVYGPALNAALAQRADIFVDWAAIVEAQPDLVDSVDGVHMPPAGRQAYRDAIVAGVGACDVATTAEITSGAGRAQ